MLGAHPLATGIEVYPLWERYADINVSFLEIKKDLIDFFSVSLQIKMISKKIVYKTKT